MKSNLYLTFLLVSFCGACVSTSIVPENFADPIQDVKKGFLLVRLRSVDNQIEILRSQRRRTEAERVRVNAKLENAKIVKAFKESFDFCPVYFFYSKFSGQVRSGNLDSIILDNQFLIVPKDKLEGKAFLVAEFANIQPPADGAGLPALIVMDSHLTQLKDPFPFYVRTTILGEEGMENKAVAILNENLKQHLNSK